MAIYYAIATVVISAAGAISGADADAAVASANERSSATAASTKNAARRASNLNVYAQNQLKRFIQNTNNNRRLDAGADAAGTTLLNARRQGDALLRSNFEQSIQTAEQLGAQAASAASAGIGGSIADNINSTTALRNDRIKGEAQKQKAAMDQDYQHTQSAIINDSINGLDNRSIYDNVDNNIDVALKYASPTWFGKFLQGGGAGQVANLGQTYSQGQGGGSSTYNTGFNTNTNATASFYNESYGSGLNIGTAQAGV